ncbi:MAG TPA: RcnB family protein [Janthinobacterium sp.]|jgi:Ni/Co efflux regulator RcnB|nr:RcnB family protein [Janthinobacterium sp.]
MNKKIIISAILASYLAVLGSVSAQDQHDNRDHGHDNGHDNGHEQDRHDAPDRRNDRNDYHPVENRGGERGAGPRHDMRKGGRLPPEYNNRQYVVDDWRGHHLSAPPRGYHWVQTGNDYVLVGIATGIIANLLLNN